MTTANLPAEKPSFDLSVMEKVIIQGDLSRLSPQERLVYYTKVCESLGLNPLTKPFDYLKLDGKLVLYAKRDATDQLRKLHKVSITIASREKIGDVYCVTARGTTPDGRTDEAIGAVPLLKEERKWDPNKYDPKTGEKGAYVKTGRLVPLDAIEMSNALMKAEAKAKRRVTLSLVGLGIMDETEIETVEGDRRIIFDDEQIPSLLGNPKQAEERSSEQNREPEHPNKTDQKSDQAPPTETPKEPKQEKSHEQQSKQTSYMLLDMKTGKSPQGITYAKMVVVDPNGEKMLVLVKDPEVLEKASTLQNNSHFEMDTAVENGFNIATNIRVLEGAA